MIWLKCIQNDVYHLKELTSNPYGLFYFVTSYGVKPQHVQLQTVCNGKCILHACVFFLITIYSHVWSQ